MKKPQRLRSLPAPSTPGTVTCLEAARAKTRRLLGDTRTRSRPRAAAQVRPVVAEAVEAVMEPHQVARAKPLRLERTPHLLTTLVDSEIRLRIKQPAGQPAEQNGGPAEEAAALATTAVAVTITAETGHRPVTPRGAAAVVATIPLLVHRALLLSR